MEVVVHSTLHSVQGRVTVATDPGQTVDSLITAFCIDKGIPHRKEFVLRNQSQEELSNTKKLCSSGVQNGDILYLGVKSANDNWACGCNQWWLLAGVALLIGAAGIVAITILKIKGGQPVYNYGVVMDCGSTHTQLFVYRWEGDKENGTAIVEEVTTCLVDGPGISNYTSDPSKAGESIKHCLQVAVDNVPKSEQKESPIYLGATAGMRLLRDVDNSTAEAIMVSVRSAISDTPFKFNDPLKQARILQGKEEGAFAWITANYLSGMFGHFSVFTQYLQTKKAETYGALDLGGASTQISFVPHDRIVLPVTYSETLVLYGHTYNIYTHSYNCYGANEAWRRYLAQLVIAANYSQTIQSPCAPKDNTTTASFDDVFTAPCSLPPTNTTATSTTFQFIGASNSSACAKEVQNLFNYTAACPVKNCTFNGIYQPSVYGEFMAMSAFYYTTSFLNLSSSTTPRFPLDKFVKATENYCSKTWEEVAYMPINKSDPSLLIRYCFEAHYIYNLLVDGYGFDKNSWNSIYFLNTINNANLGWTVGYMLNASNILPQEFPQPPINTVVFVILLILFAAFVFLSVGFVCHAKRISSRDPLEYQRLATYGSI